MSKGNGSGTKKKRELIHLPVKFKTVNINNAKAAATIGLRIERNKKFDANHIDALFTNAQVQVQLALQVGAQPDLPNQGKIDGTAVELSGIATCHGPSIRHDHFGASLKFNTAEVEIAELAQFSGKAGSVELTRIGDANEDEES